MFINLITSVYILFIVFECNIIHVYSYHLTNKITTHQSKSTFVYMSTVLQEPSILYNSNDNFNQGIYTNLQPKYISSPTSSRSMMSKKYTASNKKYMDVGIELRSKYSKYKLLTEEEELTAAKFSQVGKKLDKIKLKLDMKYKREITIQEWAIACKLSVKDLTLYKNMSVSARNRLVQHNIRLVDFWVRRFLEHSTSAQDISYYELLTEGIKGLSKAADIYDGRIRFIKFAQMYIKGELYKGMTALRPGMQLPHRSVMLCYRAYRAKSKLSLELQRIPTESEIANYLGVKVDTLIKSLRDMKTKTNVISAQTKLSTTTGSGQSKDENLVTYLDLYLKPDQINISTDKMLWQMEFLSILDNNLTPTEKRTLCLRYGLYDGIPRSVEDVSELSCVSQEGVRKIILRCFEKLRNDPTALEILADGPPNSPITTTNGRVGLMAY